mmetsp:Transcript_102635/g.290067  ORF Transcript_102635/g.290067 Transcript_102635/m.290067 type:complete len:694 (-) Transcript_102635:210-2291(-)|eukprot:CAMPEP_0117520918 /NCGR_PEP_ID=MMETSP0784-20121206/33415_1 /TAXON_ID=39447 /ORGANISM="" /LENGTH=693 /DNA_ID=CAMNT_0005316925 /DNA_START=168 /DNA_END=2249 /DNA_ORIENTATION=+
MRRSASSGGFKDSGLQKSREIVFSVVVETTPGSQVRVVGSIGALGLWQPDRAPQLFCDSSTYPEWTVTTTLPAQEHTPDGIEYKFIKVLPDGATVWEEGNNRQLHGARSGRIATAQFGRISPEEFTVTPHDGESEADDLSMSRGLSIPQDSQPAAGLPTKKFTHRRCRSTSNTNLAASAVEAELVPGCESTPPDQHITLTVHGAACAVEVVFEVNLLKMQLHREIVGTNGEIDCDLQSNNWKLSFGETGLGNGVYAFHFLVDGLRTLSQHHVVCGASNMGLFNGQLWKYIHSHGSKPRNVPNIDDVGNGKPTSFNRMASCGLTPTKKEGHIARPRSIGHNLASLGDDSSDDDVCDDAGRIVQFPDEVYEGLYGGELRLRLYGYMLSGPAEGVDSRPLQFRPGAHQISKPFGECEDAYFVDQHALGVADGVGGMAQYKSYGLNSAEYAAELMKHAQASLMPGGRVDAEGHADSAEQRALAACCAAESDALGYGASTIATIVLAGRTIGVASLGDSGFMLLRHGQDGMSMVSKSEEQQHGWNFPYQLSSLPPALLDRFKRLQQDHATQCRLYTHAVREGDLIVVFSDGLTDNLHEQEILDIVNRTLPPAFADLLGLPELSTQAESVAKSLAVAARARSRDQFAKVPFYHYSRRYGYDCLGGKEDDITVVAAWVVAEKDVKSAAMPVDEFCPVWEI